LNLKKIWFWTWGFWLMTSGLGVGFVLFWMALLVDPMSQIPNISGMP